jgi:hypothetical protein
MIFCSKCGKEVADDASFCTACGNARQGGQNLNQTLKIKAVPIGFIRSNCETALEVSAWLALALLIIFGFVAGGYIGGLLTFSDEISELVKKIFILGKEPSFPSFSFSILGAFIGTMVGGVFGLLSLAFAYVSLKIVENIEKIDCNTNSEEKEN